jgi:hypothetical protein
MTRFTDKTERFLKYAGWHESRRLDRAIVEAEILKNEYQLVPTAVEFMQEFGGLWVEGFTFSIEEFNISPAYVRNLGAYLGKHLCPIGTNMLTDLLIDEDGRVYWEVNLDSFHLVAESVEEALEKVVKDGTRLKDTIRLLERDALKALWW